MLISMFLIAGSLYHAPWGPEVGVEVPPSWIEILPWFGCNCRCVVCTGRRLPPSPGMTTEDVAGWLEEGRRRRIGGAWFGGGEPTARPDLVPLVARARALGYRRIRIQTNGMRFSYPAFARACLEAGATEVSVSVKGVDARGHDAITQVPGSFARLVEGVRVLAAAGTRVEADVMITTRSARHLPRIVEQFAKRGAQAFLFRLFSRHGLEGDELTELLPDLREVAPHLEAAFDTATELGVGASSLHTPPCVLRPAYRDRYRHARDWNVLVVPPGGPPFLAARTPMEGGAYLPGCAACSSRNRCLGPRADYLAVRGDAAFVPLREVRGPRRSPSKR
ncbi:MAG: radical SAM protein [Deltaproteobacteria bacterium]|nr:radical SAM protein [Deltaproteobacteria bacterium]